MTRPRFTVVIATRERPELLAGQRRRLAELEDGPDEVIVEEDTAGDGPAAARNRAAARATGDWLVFLDDDDEPGPDWIRAFRRLADVHPEAVWLSVGHRDRPADGPPGPSVPPLVMGAVFGGRTLSFLAGTFALRAESFAEVGGFDERLRHMEFTDLALRVLPPTAPAAMTAHDPLATITLVRRPPEDRASQRPEVVRSAAEAVLERHAERWRLDRSWWADQLGVVGVAAARSGDGRGAVDAFRRAALAAPSPRRLGRLITAAVPPLRRRQWPPPVGPAARTSTA